MAGLHVAVHDEEVVVGFDVTQFGDPLCRLPVLHLAVPISCGDEGVWVVQGRHVVVRAVLHNVVEVRLVLGVSPLVKFTGGQRNALVEHGVDDVHKWHGRDDAVEQAGCHVHDSTHQQPAGAAAHGVHVVGRGESLIHHGLSAVDEVGECVHLVEQLAVLVPVASHLAPAADVGHRVHKPAVEHAQPSHREAGVHAVAVAAVGVEEQGVLPVALGAFAVDDAHRNLGAVPGLHHDAFAHVVGGVKCAAQHFLLLQLLDVSGFEVVLQHRARRGHRGVAVAQLLGVEVGVGAHAGGVGRVVERDVLVRAPVPANQTQVRQTLFALVHHEPVVEDVNALEQHVVAMRDHVFPVFLGCGRHGCFDDFEILGVFVGHQVKVVAKVAHAVFQIALARLDDVPFAVGRVGVQEAVFSAYRCVAGDDEVRLALGLADAAREGLVLLLKHEHILAHVRAQHVLVDLRRTQRYRVFLGVKEGFVVVGPGGATGGFGDAVFHHRARAQVLDVQRVFASADGVDAVHQQVVVGAHAASSNGEVVVAFGHGRLVQHHFLLGVHRSFLAAGERILFAFLVPRVVPVAFVQDGNAFVVLLDASHNLVVDLGLHGFGRGHHGLLVRVLSFEVRHHVLGLGVGLLGLFLGVAQAHPEVVVLKLQVVDVGGVRLLRSIRRRGELRGLGHVVGLHVSGGVAAHGQGQNGGA